MDTMDIFIEAGVENVWTKTQDQYRYLSILLGSLPGVKVMNGGSEYSGHLALRVEREDITTEAFSKVLTDNGIYCGYMSHYNLTRFGIGALFLSFEECYRTYEVAKKALNIE